MCRGFGKIYSNAIVASSSVQAECGRTIQTVHSPFRLGLLPGRKIHHIHGSREIEIWELEISRA